MNQSLFDRPIPSFREQLRAIAAVQRRSDPWTDRLKRLNGKVGSDGVERISSVAVFDMLGLKDFERTPAAGKRIKTAMEQLGWSSVRQVQLTWCGSPARMRGYARQSR